MDITKTSGALIALFDKIPRRHSIENVKDINTIIIEYEALLKNIEAENIWYEKNTPIFFEELDTIKTIIKKSTDNKASKKNKDNYFDEGSGILKDSMQALITLYADGQEKIIN